MTKIFTDELQTELVGMIASAYKAGGNSVFDGLLYAARNGAPPVPMNEKLFLDMREFWLENILPKLVEETKQEIELIVKELEEKRNNEV